MFQGATALNLDSKGRLAVPARYRDGLLAQAVAGTVVLTAHPHRCLLLYPTVAWEPIRDQVLAGSGLERQSALLKRLLVGFAREEKLDSAGRLLVAAELRDYAQLDKAVYLVGQGNHFEVWSESAWRHQQEEIFALGNSLVPPGMEGLSL